LQALLIFFASFFFSQMQQKDSDIDCHISACGVFGSRCCSASSERHQRRQYCMTPFRRLHPPELFRHPFTAADISVSRFFFFLARRAIPEPATLQ
jgi:hypothetical protein